MISKILAVGNKVDIQHGQKKHQYKSKIMDIMDEETLKLSLPIEKSIVIPMAKGWRIELTFFSSKGLYRCQGEILERYKEENLYLMIVRLTSELERVQRRQFYRLPYSMEIEFRERKEEPAIQEISSEKMEEHSWNTGVTLDISGGGCRFNAPVACQIGSQLELEFFLKMENGFHGQRWRGKVTASYPVPNRNDIYENRVEFIDNDRQKREQLVKFIFEEESRIRSKDRGMES
ncbi:MAG: flagellar brake protein [Acetivibrio ethanolgignens]